MYQYYIIEIQKTFSGEYGHIVHWAFDEDKEMARLKGESKFHEVLAAAAVSQTDTHSAILIDSNGSPIKNQYYRHTQHVEPEPEPETEPETEGEN